MFVDYRPADATVSAAPTFDVFLSFSGVDRELNRALATELRSFGVQVFLDEDTIAPFTGITDGIREALRQTKTIVAYYTLDYAERPACQRELMEAFLAGQRKGDPSARIMVINPEPTTDHIRPIELADARFLVPGTGITELAHQIMKRARKAREPLGEIRRAAHPRWTAWRSGHLRNFVGRYRELWELHTALHATDYPLIEDTDLGPFAALCGLPGAGKTALATAYAWRFAAAYPGGVHWVSLAGAEPNDLHTRFGRELRRVAAGIGADLDGVPDNGVANALTGILATSAAPSLWVIDDIHVRPEPAVLDFLALPPDSAARTILISREDVFRDLLPVIRVGPLPVSDGAALLDRYRTPDDDRDRAARTEVIRTLGGNAAALVTVGEYLRDRHGLSSYAAIATGFGTDRTVTDAVHRGSGIRDVVDRLDRNELTILRVADETGISAFPARLLAMLPSLAAVDVGGALQRLRAHNAATRVGTVWRLDPLVVRASRDSPTPSPENPAAEIAHAMVGFATRPDLTRQEWEVLRDMESAPLLSRKEMSAMRECVARGMVGPSQQLDGCGPARVAVTCLDIRVDLLLPRSHPPTTVTDDAELAAHYAFPAGLDRPWVKVNFVASADGAVTVDGRSRALSDPVDQRVFRLGRGLADVVLVGAGTAAVERYRGIRAAEMPTQLRADLGLTPIPPIAVVTRGSITPTSPLITNTQVPTIVFTTESAPADRRAALADAGADVVVAGTEDVDITAVLAELDRRGLRRVACEGGPGLFGTLIAADAVDELDLSIAPLLAAGPAGRIAHHLVASPPRSLRLASVLRADDLLLLRYVRNR